LLFAIWWIADDKSGLREELVKEADAFDFENAPLDDIPKTLPRMKSFLHELHRHYGGSPLLMLEPAEDLPFCDSVIPKGTTIMVHLRYISTSPISPPKGVPFGPKSKHPSDFCPHRWLVTAKDGTLSAQSPDTKNGAFMSFGHGLRMCPGRGYAEKLQFLTLVSLLQRFDVSLEPNHPQVSSIFSFIDIPNHDIKVKLTKRK
jgi:cytochrome P450